MLATSAPTSLKAVFLFLALFLLTTAAVLAAEKPTAPQKAVSKPEAVDIRATRPSVAASQAIPQGVAPEAQGPGAIVVPLQNCGTSHTAWVDDPEADVNPCPAACERGERVSLEESSTDGKTQYKAIYRCHLPELVFNQGPELAKQIEAGGVVGENCGTFWTDSLDSPDTDANPCPAECERGELSDVRRTLSYDGSQTVFAMNYRCYKAGTMTAAASSPKLLATVAADQPETPAPVELARPVTPATSAEPVASTALTAPVTTSAGRAPTPAEELSTLDQGAATDKAVGVSPTEDLTIGHYIGLNAWWLEAVPIPSSPSAVLLQWQSSYRTNYVYMSVGDTNQYNVLNPDGKIEWDEKKKRFSLIVGQLSPGHTYHFRVRTEDGTGRYGLSETSYTTEPDLQEAATAYSEPASTAGSGSAPDAGPPMSGAIAVDNASGEMLSGLSPNAAAQPPMELPVSPDHVDAAATQEVPAGENLEKPIPVGSLSLYVEPSDRAPGMARLTWRDDSYDNRYTNEVYVSLAKENQWTPVDTSNLQSTYENELESRYPNGYHVGPLEPGKVYDFAVIRTYSNGDSRRAEVGPFDPVAPRAPDKAIAIQTGDDEVTVVWARLWDYIDRKGSCNAKKTICQPAERVTYLVHGNSSRDYKEIAAKDAIGVDVAVMPEDFMAGSNGPGDFRSVKYKGLARGTHRFSVGARYENGLEAPADQWPTAQVTVGEFTSHYRISVQGIKIQQATEDDPLEYDGKGDEIYIMARSCDNKGCEFPRSPVFGDVNGFSDRKPAGSASTSGGIRSGDYLGLANTASGMPTDVGFPFLLWEGSLREFWDYVLVTPSVWEWDFERGQAHESVFRDFTYPGHVEDLPGLGLAQYYRHVYTSIISDRTYNEPCQLHAAAKPRDKADADKAFARPIGAKYLGLDSFGVEQIGVACSTLSLTRRKLEEGLGGLSSQVIALDLPDMQSGHYTMYIKIERLP